MTLNVVMMNDVCNLILNYLIQIVIYFQPNLMRKKSDNKKNHRGFWILKKMKNILLLKKKQFLTVLFFLVQKKQNIEYPLITKKN